MAKQRFDEATDCRREGKEKRKTIYTKISQMKWHFKWKFSRPTKQLQVLSSGFSLYLQQKAYLVVTNQREQYN